MNRALLVSLMCLVSCARMYPDKVAMGVARLSVRDAAVLTALINADTTCGFASPGVLSQPQINESAGTVQWTVKDCRLSFGGLREVAKDCGGVATRVGGAVVVSATRTITGTLTGNTANPVVPMGPDAVVISITAKPEDFIVRIDGQKTALTIHSGVLSYQATPRLAVSSSKGVCAVPTNDVRLEGLKYDNADVTIDNDGSLIDADVASSSFSAQVGKGADRENALWGQLTVFGSSQTMPTASDKDGLDPTYDSDAYRKTWSCAPDLAQPISNICPSLDEAVGQGAARLTVMAAGKLASLIDSDTHCGFSNPAVIAAAVNTGIVGDREGSSTTSISAPCRVQFDWPTVVSRDCNGVEYTMQGAVLVTGTKTVRGIVSGDPLEPVVPTSRDAAELKLSFAFDTFKIGDSKGHALSVTSGTLSGTVHPRLAKDTMTGACSIVTAVADFSHLSWAKGVAKVTSDGNTLNAVIDSSAIEALNGNKNGNVNTLAGTMWVNSKLVTMPAVLDPEYNQTSFDASYACLPHMVVPASEADCSLYPELAKNAARLMVQTAGAAASRVNADKKCGFETLLVKVAPTSVQGGDGEMGSMKWHVNTCNVGHEGATDYATNCSGAKDFVEGTLGVSATRTVTGMRKVLLGVINSITPASSDAVTIALDKVDLVEVAAWRLDPGATAPRGKLVFHTGELSGTVLPITAQRRSAPGTYDISTPIARFSELSLGEAHATLFAGPKRFNLNLTSAKLSAMNGRWMGQGNTMTGTVVIDGQTVTIAGEPLDPLYDQPAFDASYACTSDMQATIAP